MPTPTARPFPTTYLVIVILAISTLMFGFESYRLHREVGGILDYLHTPVAYDAVAKRAITRADVIRLFVDSAAASVREATKPPAAEVK